jgi:opacity protein-like surface antigen
MTDGLIYQVRRLSRVSAILGLAAFASATTAAEGFYISGSIGLTNLDDSSNSGSFNSDFTTGEVTGVSPALTLPAGSALGWETTFANGNAYGLAFGYDYGSLRVEFSLDRNDSNVDTHRGVTAGGIDLSTIDAGVLLSGNSGDLGITTAGLVANGQGRVRTTSVMLNGYYDFDLGNSITPYIGLGVGNATTDVGFAPSGTLIAEDDDDGFAYQVILGAEYAATDAVSFFGNYRYFTADDATVGLSLAPASLDVENRFSVIEIGLRFSF